MTKQISPLRQRMTTGDINGECMVIHGRQAKGHKDRY
jgi:hypothetical protein